ncbi:MAG: hypothetical protein ACRDQZ_06765, partial [Mycobacteriales bacterium]
LVWCELPLPAGTSATAVPLPRRERRRSPEAERLADQPDEVDPQLINRILLSLNRPAEDNPGPGAGQGW